ncbi:MAG: RICIN domain-containing protein, partial [Bacteroidales bacterium]|nr:RICIN domain-containing protein [Bacteroidales bacterium]
MIRKLIYLTILLALLSVNANAQSPVNIVKGKFIADKGTTLLKTFPVSKGDVIEFKLTTLHKRRGLNIWIRQHPGNLLVLDFEDLTTSTKKIVAPVDAIYQIFYGGSKLDIEIEVNNYTSSPNGPGRGEPVYVRIPDTLHASGYVTRSIGENYTLTPQKEKVLLKTSIQSEQICSRDFITGVDLIELNIPGNVKDEYREQKLLSYSVTLTCGEIGMYNAMMGVVDAGIDAFVKIPGPKSENKAKLAKAKDNNQYKFTDKLDDAAEKIETTKEIVDIGKDGADTLAPGSSTAKVLEGTAFVLDGGIQKMVLETALDKAGAPKEMKALIGAVQEFPSLSDITKGAVHKLVPSIKGNARLQIIGEKIEKEIVAKVPTKEFWIQSAMNYGKNPGGCWDVPGGPTAGQNGQDINCWDIDNGIDRKFKFVPSSTHPGYYEIHSAMSGFAIDNSGGNGNMDKNGNNILLWQRHGGESQLFKIKHLGNGKLKIINFNGLVVHLSGRKNGNGTNIAIWEDHGGAWMEWYLVDPITRQGFVPTENKTIDVLKKYTIADRKGGLINEKILLDNAGEVVKAYLRIDKDAVEAKAKLVVEAQYEITDYTDVIKYVRTTQPVNTKDFWTAYKVDYDYQIMFKDQVKDYYQIVPMSEYYSSQRPASEELKSADYE